MTTTVATQERPEGGTLSIPDGMRRVADIRKQTLATVQQAQASGDLMMRDLAIAYGLEAMRAAFTAEVVAVIANLGGTALGFRHDLETRGQKYSPEIVRDCAIEALMRGVSLTGNQFNIIAARCYITREGYQSLLASYPGLTDLEIEVGLPEDGKPWGKQEMVFVTAAARCNVAGRAVSVECRKSEGFDGRLAVKTFSGEVDNAKGKAQRRLLKLLYERITGSVIAEPDDGVEQAGSVIAIERHESPASDVWAAEAGRIEAPRAKDAWAALVQAANPKRIDEIMEGVKKIDATARDRESLERFAMHRLEELSR